jgi:hypothetical protein
VRRLTLSIGVPILAIVLTWVGLALAAHIWPAIIRGFHFVLCAALVPVGVWVQRTAVSKAQLLGALIGPVAYVGYWAWLVGAVAKELGFFQPTALDYAGALAPMLGIVLGYAYATAGKRFSSSV